MKDICEDMVTTYSPCKHHTINGHRVLIHVPRDGKPELEELEKNKPTFRRLILRPA